MHKINTKTHVFKMKHKGYTSNRPKTTRSRIVIETRENKSKRSKINRTSKNINQKEAEINTEMPEVSGSSAAEVV